jgi:hypothetical protein
MLAVAFFALFYFLSVLFSVLVVFFDKSLLTPVIVFFDKSLLTPVIVFFDKSLLTPVIVFFFFQLPALKILLYDYCMNIILHEIAKPTIFFCGQH